MKITAAALRYAVRIICLFILIIVSLPVAACNSRDRVTLQLQWITQTQFAGYYVALDKGWYAAQGIDLTIIPGGPAVSAADSVADGKSDFGTGFLSDLCLAVDSGKPLISIAQIQQKSGMLLIAKASSGIKEPADFIGKTVGVWLGSWDVQFKALLADEGIDTKSINVFSQGSTMDPFITGQIDVASAMTYAEYQLDSVQSIALNVIDYADYGLGFPGDVLFTNQKTAKQNPDLCMRMLAATLEGWQYAVDHPEEATDIVLKHDTTGSLVRKEQLSMMNEISKLVVAPGHGIGYTDRTAVKQTIYILRKSELKEPLQPEDVFTDVFWNEINDK